MSHAYYLRPNVKGRMQRRLNAHVAAFGLQNQDKIIAKPSETGQGVHLFFDPERSLSPDPEQTAEHQCADSTEGVIVIDDESDSSEDSSSGLASDLDTIAPDTPSPRGSFHPSSQLRAPKAPRLAKSKYWREGSVASSTSVQDSMATIAERKQALNDHLDGRRRHFLEQQIVNFEKQNEKFRRESGLFTRDEGPVLEDYPQLGSPVYSEFGGDSFREFTPPPLPQSAPGPSRLGSGMQEDRMQQRRALRRQNNEQLIMAKRGGQTPARKAAGGEFVVVARNFPKLGPSGTVVIDHDTNQEISVKKHYRVRAEDLLSIDGDGDSVMGDDL